MIREEIHLKTRGETDVLNVTERVQRIVAQSGFSEGTLHLFTPGATAGVTTIEYEPGCIQDLKDALERVAPREGYYHHNERWGDGNGFSHVRSALVGPSLSVPFSGGKLMLGTWQQLIVVDFDNRRRDRKLLVTVSGD